MTPEFKRISDNQYSLSGELNMQTVPPVARETQSMFAGLQGDVSVDLSGVTRADSAGLALLVDWLRLARRHKVTLRFRHLPDQLVQIARVSELDRILPIEA